MAVGELAKPFCEWRLGCMKVQSVYSSHFKLWPLQVVFSYVKSEFHGNWLLLWSNLNVWRAEELIALCECNHLPPRMAKCCANFHNLALESFCYLLTKVVGHIMASYFLQLAPLMCGLHIIHLIHALIVTTHALSTVNQHAVRQSIAHQDK